MQVWIGTSGYSYSDWVGPFYPPGTQSNRMLGIYSRHFPLVELNFTFYRPPTSAMLSRIARQSPPGFQFIVKLPRAISHERDQAELPGFREAVEELHQGARLAGLLCQLPQSCHYDSDSRAWLATIGKALGPFRLAVEFRHRSWHRADVPAWLRQHHIDLVAVDVPDLSALYPRGLAQSGRRIYLRFHSRNAEMWYGSDMGRYDYDYADDELMEWVSAIQAAAAKADQALVLFNNCQLGQAAANARRMRELLAQAAPELDIVEPFASAPPGTEQPTLFD